MGVFIYNVCWVRVLFLNQLLFNCILLNHKFLFVLGEYMVIPPNSTKITHACISSTVIIKHMILCLLTFFFLFFFLLNFLLAVWSVFLTDSLISSPYCQNPEQRERAWQATPSGNFSPTLSKVGPTQTFAVIYTLSMSSAASGASYHHQNIFIHVNRRGNWHCLNFCV